jgi:uncharacterized protein YndB with AHSA1/START domain
MGKAEFIYVSYIATTPEKLWAALTSGDFTRAYWYDRRIESEWKVGAPVRFYDGGSDVVTDAGEVLEIDPPKRLVYTFQPLFSEEVAAMPVSRVSFTIEAYEGLVKLTLLHDQLADEEMAAGFREGWSPILSSLKTFLETGKPLPQLKSFEEQGRPQTADSEG